MSKKIYKQRFRKEWLEHPQLRAWLTVREGPEGLLPACRLCDRTLDVKVNGLVKHNSCKKHQDKLNRNPNNEMCLYRISSKLWNHFVRLDGDAARCKYCRAELAYGDSTASLEEHLQSEHPTVKYGDTQKKFTIVVSSRAGMRIVPRDKKENSNQEKVEEVIIDNDDASLPDDATYVDDPFSQSDQEDLWEPDSESAERKLAPTKRLQECKNEIEYKDNATSNFAPKARSKRTKQAKPIVEAPVEKEDTIEHFGRYVMSLLYSMPAELASQVQLDAVSMMLSAKMKYEEEQKGAVVGSREEEVVGSFIGDPAS